jgi:hypothetical protein
MNWLQHFYWKDLKQCGSIVIEVMSANTNNQEVAQLEPTNKTKTQTMDSATLQAAREQAKVAFLQSLKDQYLP